MGASNSCCGVREGGEYTTEKNIENRANPTNGKGSGEIDTAGTEEQANAEGQEEGEEGDGDKGGEGQTDAASGDEEEDHRKILAEAVFCHARLGGGHMLIRGTCEYCGIHASEAAKQEALDAESPTAEDTPTHANHDNPNESISEPGTDHRSTSTPVDEVSETEAEVETEREKREQEETAAKIREDEERRIEEEKKKEEDKLRKLPVLPRQKGKVVYPIGSNVELGPAWGLLRAAISFSTAKSLLTVFIAGCDNLVSFDTNGASDPYVKARIVPENPKEPTKQKTPTKFVSLSPTFNHKMEFKLTHDKIFKENYALEVQVWDHDTLHKSRFMCGLLIDLSRVPQEEKLVEIAYALQPKHNFSLGANSIKNVDTIHYPDGSIKLPNGTFVIGNSKMIQSFYSKIPDGAQKLHDDTLLFYDGSVLLPSGAKLRPDGLMRKPDGKLVKPAWHCHHPSLPKEVKLETDKDGSMAYWLGRYKIVEPTNSDAALSYGIVKFRIKPKEKKNKVELYVREARGLPGLGKHGASLAYVKAYLKDTSGKLQVQDEAVYEDSPPSPDMSLSGRRYSDHGLDAKKATHRRKSTGEIAAFPGVNAKTKTPSKPGRDAVWHQKITLDTNKLPDKSIRNYTIKFTIVHKEDDKELPIGFVEYKMPVMEEKKWFAIQPLPPQEKRERSGSSSVLLFPPKPSKSAKKSEKKPRSPESPRKNEQTPPSPTQTSSNRSPTSTPSKEGFFNPSSASSSSASSSFVFSSTSSTSSSASSSVTSPVSPFSPVTPGTSASPSASPSPEASPASPASPTAHLTDRNPFSPLSPNPEGPFVSSSSSTSSSSSSSSSTSDAMASSSVHVSSQIEEEEDEE